MHTVTKIAKFVPVAQKVYDSRLTLTLTLSVLLNIIVECDTCENLPISISFH